MPRLAAFGMRMDLPPGWEGRVRKRTPEPGATTHAILHAASFALPVDRGDYGGGAVELMTQDDVFVTLFEHEPAHAHTALFAAQGIPQHLSPSDFSPVGLQRVLQGQSGLQRFFTEQDRAFCLYVVLGSHARRGVLVPRAEALVRTLVIEPRAS